MERDRRFKPELLLDSIGEALFAVDPSGRCVYVNRAGLRLLGQSDAVGVLGMHLHDIIHGSSEAAAGHGRSACQIQRALERSTDTHIANEVLWRRDGTRAEVEYRSHPIRSDDSVIGAVVTCMDIGKYRHAEEEGLFNRVLLYTQSEASIDGILVVSSDTKMLSFNRRFVELWGVPEAIIESRSDEAALSWVLQKLVDPDAFIAKVHYLYEHKEEKSRDVLALKDGRVFDRYSAPVTSREGVYYGRVWFFRDITELKQAEAELVRLYGEAQEAIGLRDEFLSIASHELKTPLTGLRLEIQAIARQARKKTAGATSPEWIETKMETLLGRIDRLSKLTENLLDVSRLAAGRLDLELEDVDLATVARDVAGRHEQDLARSGSKLSIRAEGPVVGRWDRMRVEEIIGNLLTNAIKYGRGQPIEVTLEREGRWAKLNVRDRGIGIGPADKERIFRRFERAVSQRDYGGFGLGLWIVSQVASTLGGSVEVTSELGVGSSFTVTLPLATSDADSPSAMSPPRLDSMAPTSSRS